MINIMFEVNLISEMQHHECLYNRSHPGYRNKKKRDESWQAVATFTGMSVDNCQGRWKTLRDRMVQEVNRRPTKDINTPVKWKYYNSMLFLKEFIAPKKTTSGGSSSSFSGVFDFVETLPLDEKPVEETSYDETGTPTTSSVYLESESETNSCIQPPKRKKMKGEQLELSKVISQIGDLVKQKVPKKEVEDPFYKYLESIINRVDEPAAHKIKLELINIASKRISEIYDLDN